MQFWFYIFSLGILFAIIEFFTLSFDFLVLTIGCVVTGIVGYFLSWDYSNRKEAMILTGIILMILELILIYLIRPILKKSDKENDSIVGEVLIVQTQNRKYVVFMNGVYHKIRSEDKIKKGDSVKVIKQLKTILYVQKLF